MMILVIECDEHVGPGLLAETLAESGKVSRSVRLWKGERLDGVGRASAAFILGGRMGAGDEEKFPYLADLKEFIRGAAIDALPVFGICLGGQLMADALGGRVYSARNGEKGIGRVNLTSLGVVDPVFSTLPYNFVTFHWHNDSFDIPEGALLLATNRVCPAQAFRYDSSIYGVQFHPEMDRATAEKWAMEEGKPGIFSRYLECEQEHRSSGKAMMGNFLKYAGSQRI